MVRPTIPHYYHHPHQLAAHILVPCPSHRIPFANSPKTLRGLFAGSGSVAMSDPHMAQAVLSLLPRHHPRHDDPNEDVNLLYLGTATYDLERYKKKQTRRFEEMGCRIRSLDVANGSFSRSSASSYSSFASSSSCSSSSTTSLTTTPMTATLPTYRQMEDLVQTSDIILVSGGNTQYALDTWRHLGLDTLLKRAALEEDKVICGGSAGAICWFDGGHSDSLDPETFRESMLEKWGDKGGCEDGGGIGIGIGVGDGDGDGADVEHQSKKEGGKPRSRYFNHAIDDGSSPNNGNGNRGNVDGRVTEEDEDFAQHPEQQQQTQQQKQSQSLTQTQQAQTSWPYIRVPALSILPGLLCPHYDRIQSNGVPRMVDFNDMMLRHPKELGIGIDHYAALVVEGEDFRVLHVEGEKGSVTYDDTDGDDNYQKNHDAEAANSVIGKGVPGVWIKYVDDYGMVQSKVCPKEGKVRDLLQRMKDPKKDLVMDERVELCRVLNPIAMD